MFWKKFIAISASVFLMLVSACNLPGGPAVVSGTNQDPTAAIQTRAAEIVASTAAAQTAFANAVASTLAAMATNTPEFTFTPSLTPTPTFTLTSTPMFTLTPSLTPTPTFTLTPSLTSTPTFTLTPSLTPTPTFTLTPEVPMVSVSVQTNCRSGPGPAYDILGILNVGQTAEVVGRSVYNDNWIIKLPSNPAVTCWLWGQYATVTGNTGALPVFNPPPTPTPTPGFTVTYLQIYSCPGIYAFKFQLTNTGSVTWQSYKVDVTDSNTAQTKTYTSDSFIDYTVCGPPTNQLLDLEPSESGVTGNWFPALFDYDPAGHNITTTFTLYAQNGLTGQSTTRTITFTP